MLFTSSCVFAHCLWFQPLSFLCVRACTCMSLVDLALSRHSINNVQTRPFSELIFSCFLEIPSFVLVSVSDYTLSSISPSKELFFHVSTIFGSFLSPILVCQSLWCKHIRRCSYCQESVTVPFTLKLCLEVCLGCCGKEHSRVGTERLTDAVEVNEYFLEEMTPKWISEWRVGVKQSSTWHKCKKFHSQKSHLHISDC